MFFDEIKCAHCGKMFCIPCREMWAYKDTDNRGATKYFCKYTCMLHFREERKAKKKPLESKEKERTDTPNDIERKRAYQREYYHRSVLNGTFKYPDPEKSRAYHRAYYQKHKEELRERYNTEYHKKQRNEITKRWIANNRDRWNAYQREYARKRKLGVKV